MKPGDDAGACPKCGDVRVCVGYGHSVIGVYCDRCDLTVVPTGTAMSRYDAIRVFDDTDGATVGPDPNP